jgi:hypothetical protein
VLSAATAAAAATAIIRAGEDGWVSRMLVVRMGSGVEIEHSLRTQVL